MSPTAILLILVSAILHASWNYVGKRQDPRLAFFFLTSLTGALLAVGVLVGFRRSLPLLPPSIWPLVVATGVAQAVYFSGLAGAYRHGDISLAYPLARALPVLMVAGASILLGRGGQIGRPGLLGMVLVTAGCIVLPLPSFRLRWRDYGSWVYLMALVAALGTTGYTLLDDAALRRLRESPRLALGDVEATLLYMALQVSATALMLGVVILLTPSERVALVRQVRSRRALRTALLTGLVIMSAYGLVLAAMAFVDDVSYVAAFRQLSIPLGALLGLTLGGEPAHPPRLAGIGVVTAGLLLVGLG